MKKTTQKDDILQELKTYNCITTWTAFQEYGITRLSAIIYNLRHEGYPIVSIPKKFKSRHGRYSRYVEYRLIDEDYAWSM